MRRVPLFLALYVTLDFANPLMPGAVRFEAGSIESVQADRTARAGLSILAGPGEHQTRIAVTARVAATRPALASRAVRRPSRRSARRVNLPHRPDPPSSATEDH